MGMKAGITAPSASTPRQIYFWLGESLSGLDRNAEAWEAYEKALREQGDEPRDADILIALAGSMRREGKPQKAFHAYLEAAANAPELLEEALEHAHSLMSRQTAVSACKWVSTEWAPGLLRRQLDRPDLAAVAVMAGRVSIFAGDFAAALRWFKQAEASNPDDVTVLEGLGESLWRTGTSLEEGLSYLGRAAEAAARGNHPERLPIVELKQIQLLCDLGEYEKASHLIDQRTSGEDPFAYELLLARARCELGLGRAEAALGVAEQAASLRQGAALPHLLRGEALIAMGRHQEAVDAADEALKHSPSDAEVLLVKARALIEGGLDAELTRSVLRILKRVPGAASTRPALVPETAAKSRGWQVFLAELRLTFGDHDGALAAIDEALARGEAGNAGAKETKGRILEQLDRRPEAANWLFSAGVDHYTNERFAEAQDALERANELEPGLHAVYWYLSDSLRALAYTSRVSGLSDPGSVERALEVWARGYALGRPPAEYSWAYVVKARCLEDASVPPSQSRVRWWTATALVERTLLLAPGTVYGWAYLCRYYRMLRLDAAAVEASRRAVEQSPADGFVLSERASALADVGLSEAFDVVDRYQSQLSSPDPWGFGVKAIVLGIEGQYEQMLRLLDQGLEGEPGDTWLRSLRGRSYWLLGRDAEAEADLRLVLDDADAETVNRAWAALELNRLEEAQRLFHELQASYPGDPFDVSLGLAYTHLGLAEVGAARAGFDNALQYLDNRRKAREVVQDLDRLERQLSGVEVSLPLLHEQRQRVAAMVGELDNLVYDHDSAERELEEAMNRGGFEPGGPEWTGAFAGVARCRAEGGRWQQSLMAYETLGQAGDFPEAEIGVAAARKHLGL